MHLRLIKQKDLEILREWKNTNKSAFFHKEEITAAQQKKWFSTYKSHDLDYMFMVVQGKPIGCIGIRCKGKEWDVYNVILGIPGYGKKGIMGEAIREVIENALILQFVPVTIKVLKGNEAINWYNKNGFTITKEFPDYFEMTYQVE